MTCFESDLDIKCAAHFISVCTAHWPHSSSSIDPAIFHGFRDDGECDNSAFSEFQSLERHVISLRNRKISPKQDVFHLIV
jgi:hypothetical protein